MIRFSDICSGCGEDAETDPCKTCDTARHRRRLAANKNMYPPEERKRMKAVVAAAETNRATVCWLCRSRKPPPGYDAKWVADHEDAGHVGSTLHPAHRGCNSARGNRAPTLFRQALDERLPDWF